MKRILYFVPVLLLLSCAGAKPPAQEFRGVWIATVANIDWPKNPEDGTLKKKQDFIDILDFYREMNFNAAIVQVRTAGDALYKTDLAPWSSYLSGVQGEAPNEFESPLEWMIDEAHKRGMEFHAWLNPYRATFDLDTLALAPDHDFYRHPDWMVKYGPKYYYDPGLPGVRDKFNRIVEELVQKFEVDAIHFDDYFYPYKIEGERFADSLTYATYGLAGQDLEDWRRSNVDSLVAMVHRTIDENKPWVQFGISPFGVWKNRDTDPRGSDTRAGQTTYEDLYADPLLWVREGWLDYLAPQVYWSMDFPAASHKKIGSWWAEALPPTNLYLGNGTYKIKNNHDPAWMKDNELPKQLDFARAVPEIDGSIFFSAKSLMGKHEKINQKLKRKFYRYPSQNPGPLDPQVREIQIPVITSIGQRGRTLELCVEHFDDIPRSVNVYELGRKKRQLLFKTYLSGDERSGCLHMELPKGTSFENLGITIRDAFGNESALRPLNQ